MSYDLMVFDPGAAPGRHSEFMVWYAQQTEWSEGHSYNDPTVSIDILRGWFVDIIQKFPPLNGPLSSDELPDDEASATDYSIGKSIIYCAFAWSKAELAYTTAFQLAEKHGVGFFNVSSSKSEVWLPASGRLRLAHSGQT